jgi:hypothetical protein
MVGKMNPGAVQGSRGSGLCSRDSTQAQDSAKDPSFQRQFTCRRVVQPDRRCQGYALKCADCGVISAPRCEHSRKPDEAYEIIERMYPGLPRIELFARGRRPGWDAWGNQANTDGTEAARLDQLPPIEPSRTTLNWIKSRQIAWAKGRASA